MTPRVPLVCTPEEARQLFFALSDYFVTLQAGINDPARVLGLIDALFRPAEERKEAERDTGFDSRSGATLPSSSGAGMANPVAGGRAPSQDALSSAPAAPPPAEERADLPASEESSWAPVLVESRTPETESVMIHHAHRGQACVACELAALRSELAASQREVERVKGEMVTAQREAYVIGRRDGRLANNNPAPAKEEVVEGWRQVARNYYPAVPSGENRSEG